MKLHPIWNNYPQLQSELTETLKLMEDSIQLKNKSVRKALLEMIGAGGKLLRPAYQLLFSQFGPKQDRNKAIALAAAIEMLHTATLIHDDIVDDASLRRNLPTISAAFDNNTAVYAGDYLFVACFKLMSGYTGTLRSLQKNASSMENILTGELGQMADHYNLAITVEEYLANISGKTAELFALSCSVGAFESGSSQLFAKNVSDIGHQIGMAFQIIDDILDYTQNGEGLGKPVLKDVQQGVYTLPLIYALHADRQQLVPLLEKKEQMTQIDKQKVYQLVNELGGVAKAQQLANTYTQNALKKIENLPNDSQNTKVTLYQLTETLLTRTN
ncbi:polyprenyl synthetase family protein [Tetragenococcus halophilus]|uniref:polyprenyl synthetase family protein n=1 Tax=Tetragenococcus halophilus TaxID=51669 RepID=UPI000CB0B6C8|nr:polyprenyl synthetase family protein [Tetragenococcus halophilus]RQD30910.1 polyprenyl synthetase family protein [Tetragenococcus halophilus subsp. halophilus DSM 20339]GBD59828.1 putative polyprenyl diphosphate synthase [Tetragenococcus halophilus subsp. halophilus]GMG62765.1 polyprenyl synthetase family protein [Tetragenococcus halophilus]